MLLRTFASALLLILSAFLSGTPSRSVDERIAAVATMPDGGLVLVAQESLSPDISDGVLNPSLGDDDSPDGRRIRRVTVVSWPSWQVHPAPRTAQRLQRTHACCAAQPRAPPIA